MGEGKAPTETDPLVGDNRAGKNKNNKNNDVNDSNNWMSTMSPMETHETLRRKRIMVALAMISGLLAVFGALLVWRLFLMRQVYRAQLPALQAARALDRLNHHIKQQSRDGVKAGCESTLLLFRHCEKVGPYYNRQQQNSNDDDDDDDDTNKDYGDEHCSYLGYERAAHLATLFGDHHRDRWPIPAHLFALSPDRSELHHLTYREWETLQPLSKKTGIMTEIVDRYSLPKLYFELLQSGSMCGQVVAVTWKHEYIPELARELACGPANGCPDDGYPEDTFDQLWQLKYVYHPNTKALNKEKDSIVVDDYSNATTTSSDPTDEDSVIGDTPPNLRGRRRRLTHHTKPFSRHGWNVYATVTNQNFDPLSYSKSIGDYPRSGTGTGGRWKQQEPPVRRLYEYTDEHDEI